jgi:hypothetical protein
MEPIPTIRFCFKALATARDYASPQSLRAYFVAFRKPAHFLAAQTILPH